MLGVTGSGKNFTMANIIQRLNRPTLVLAHNKTLAAQLCAEFREFFPENAVEYFVSYYDYYQPEAYIPHTDTYIEKDASTNDEIDRLRLSATCSLLERRVRHRRGLGQLHLRSGRARRLRPNDDLPPARHDHGDGRASAAAGGGPLRPQRYGLRAQQLPGPGRHHRHLPGLLAGQGIRVEFFGDEIDRISQINAVTGMPEKVLSHVPIYPASHYITPRDKMARAITEIEAELWDQVKYFEEHDKLLEAQRIRQRTLYDIERMQELGYCSGIENYSRIISGRPVGSAPMTLLDYFPKDFLLFVDESHVTLPQVRAMYNGDRARRRVWWATASGCPAPSTTGP